MAEQTIDIREDNILARSPELLATLLKDHTMSREKGRDCNIFWATADYAPLGVGFQYGDEILPENITGRYGDVVQPRVCNCSAFRRTRHAVSLHCRRQSTGAEVSAIKSLQIK